MRMMRCKADLAIRVTGRGGVEYLWPGLEVDFDRELATGFTIADAVAGRENCFEPVTSADAAPASEEAVDA